MEDFHAAPRQVAVGAVLRDKFFGRLPPAQRPRHDGEAVALRPRRRDVVYGAFFCLGLNF